MWDTPGMDDKRRRLEERMMVQVVPEELYFFERWRMVSTQRANGNVNCPKTRRTVKENFTNQYRYVNLKLCLQCPSNLGLAEEGGRRKILCKSDIRWGWND